MITRRSFIASLSLAALADPAQALSAGHELILHVKMAGFGGASESDIKAVLLSAAGEIWKHCPGTRFEQPGFEIYHNGQFPITHFDLAADGSIRIGLDVEGNLWARFAYQFAHEFTHALMDHSNDSQKLWLKLEHANQWIEESICETASLFSLRAMAQTWKTNPPYPNWKSYSSSLADYAAKHLDDPRRRLPDGQTFPEWFAVEEPGLRKNWSQRDKNTIVACQLLPLFEAEPAGWEAVTALNLGTHDIDKTLAKHLAEWRDNAPADHRPFIARFAALFGVKVQS